MKTGRAGIGFAALFALLPAAAVGGGMLFAPVQALMGLIAAPAPGTRARALGFLQAAAPLLLFAAWTAISLSWSAVQRPEQAVKIVGAVATGVLLIAGIGAASAQDRALARAAVIAGVIMICALSAVEAGFDLPLNRIDEPATAAGILERNPGKGVSILVLLIWGALGALLQGARWRKGFAAILLAATGVLALQFHMDTNASGLTGGLAAFAAGWIAPRAAPLCMSGALALWVLIAPWVTPAVMALPHIQNGMPLSWRMRGQIWSFARDRIAERPITGWGLDGARQFSNRILTIDDLDFQAIPLHPHSFSIHVWLETGGVGAVLVAAAIMAGGIAASRTLRGSRAAAAATCGVMAAAGLIWNVSYGAWQEWWIGAVFIALAAAAAVRREPATV